MITFEEIKKDPGIRTYIQKADESLINLGFTEHSFAHVGLVAANSKYILETLGYTPREVELVQIAAYLHDIGNLVNRIDHSQSGAVMAFRLLDHLHMDPLGHCRGGHCHWQPRRGDRYACQSHGGGVDSGGQIRRPPQPGAQPGHQQV